MSPARVSRGALGWGFLAAAILLGLGVGARLWPQLRGAEAHRVQAPQGPVAVTAAAPPSFADIVDKVMPAVVSVEAAPTIAASPPTGRRAKPPTEPAVSPAPAPPNTGVLISADGFVLTASSAIPASDAAIAVRTEDGVRRPARLVGQDEASGLAVIKIDGDHFPFVRFSREVARLGAWGILVGNDGRSVQIAAGLLARTRPALPQAIDYLQFQLQAEPFFNGAPVVDVRGRVIAIVQLPNVPAASGAVVGVPAGLARAVALQLSRTGSVAWGYPQAAVQDLTPSLVDRLNLSTAKGVLIDAAPPASPAGLAGLRPGDVVVAIDGEPVANSDDYLRRLANPPVKTVTVAVLRGGAQLDIPLPPPPAVKTEKSAGLPPARSRR